MRTDSYIVKEHKVIFFTKSIYTQQYQQINHGQKYYHFHPNPKTKKQKSDPLRKRK